MNSTLETFIREHRSEFDRAEPGGQTWDALEKSLDRLAGADALERLLAVERPLLDTETPAPALWSAIETALPPAGADNLERFIRSERAAFDSREPERDLWADISRQLPAGPIQGPRLNWSRNLLRAAAAIALLVTGMGAGFWYANHQNNAPQAGMAMSDVSTEYAELEQYYRRDIAGKEQQLASFAGYNEADVLTDLRQMDIAMEELRKDLATVPPGNREQVVRAMIENYKAKLAILQRVLEHLQQSSDLKNSGKNEIKSI